MGTSGNPAKRTPTVSSASEFKSKKYKVLELPSGLVAKVKNVGGLATFMRAGMIPNSLMGVVDKALKGAKPETEDLMPEGNVDPKVVVEMMEFFDKMIVQTMVEPQVYPPPADEEARDEELLYADEIDDQDKMFVFQWLSGGTADLEEFRQRQAANMAALGGSN